MKNNPNSLILMFLKEKLKKKKTQRNQVSEKQNSQTVFI